MVKKDVVQQIRESVKDAAGKPVSSNPALIVFPTDIWGVTTDLKDAIRLIAARVSGCPTKYELVMQTLDIGIQHIKERYNADCEKLAKSDKA